MKRTKTVDDAINELFDYAATHREGFTAPEARDALGISQTVFESAIRGIRRIFDTGKETLVADRRGHNEPWLYRLVSTYEDAEGWAGEQLRHLETRIGTMVAVLSAIVRATDGRTRNGKKAREFLHTLKYLVERLEMVDEEFSTTKEKVHSDS